jgi:high-affinity iron transporter
MFQNFLIGLREGIEASLVVGILVAYLVKTGHRDRLPAVWLGIGLAVGLSLSVGALLTFGSSELSFEAQETFAGFMSILAVGFVTWMVFWMRSQSKNLKAELHHKMDSALAMGAGALAIASFVAVGREGLETALFLWPTMRANGNGAGPALGAVLGIGTAVVVGWLIYRKSVSFNLATFFRWTGAALVVVAAGVLAYGVHDLQEAGVLPGLDNIAFDVSAQIPPSSWYGTLLKGIFNFSPKSTWLQVYVYVGYLVPVMFLFLRPTRSSAPAPAASTTTAPSAPTASAATVPAGVGHGRPVAG